MKFPAIDKKGLVFELEADGENFLNVFEGERLEVDPFIQLLKTWHKPNPPEAYRKEIFSCGYKLKAQNLAKVDVEVYLHESIQNKDAQWIIERQGMFFGSYGRRAIDFDYHGVSK